MIPLICDDCDEEMKETLMYGPVYMCPKCGKYLNKNEVLDLTKRAELQHLLQIRIK